MNSMKAKYAGTGKGMAPIGVVRVIDSDGAVVRETHNMVVLDGQRIMLRLFLDKFMSESDATATGSNDIELDGKLGMNICFGYNTNPATTVETMSWSDVEGDLVYNRNLTAAGNGYSSVEYSMADAGICLTLKKKLIGEDIKAFNEIILACRTANAETPYLFSRALIDPVFLGNESSYTISYTLYF